MFVFGSLCVDNNELPSLTECIEEVTQHRLFLRMSVYFPMRKKNIIADRITPLGETWCVFFVFVFQTSSVFGILLEEVFLQVRELDVVCVCNWAHGE